MTKIIVYKKYNYYTGIKFEGHADHKFGKPGQNILCAAISTLSQTLLINLLKKDLVETYNIDKSKGLLELTVKRTWFKQLFINHAFEFALDGLQDLRDTFPQEIEIVY